MPCRDLRKVRIELTPEQRKIIALAIGEELFTLDFTVEELEQRITPFTPNSV
jgi:DNA-binding MarR family transcriptional regulator